MKLRILLSCFIFAGLAVHAHGREHAEDRKPLVLSQPNFNAQLFSSDDLKELAGHDATLRAIELRLSGIDGKLTDIQSTLDKDVLPTIHVIDFLKWLMAAIVAVIIGEWIRSMWGKKKPQSASA